MISSFWALKRARDQWLYHGLKRFGLPVVCMDARRASDAVKARAQKSERADAQALAGMPVSGRYSPVHVKSGESHRIKALPGARDRLIQVIPKEINIEPYDRSFQGFWT